MRNHLFWMLSLALLLPCGAPAQTVQPVKIMDATVLGKAAGTATNPLVTTPVVNAGGKTEEVLVTNAAGGTTLSTSITALSGRKAFEIQNLGPNAIYCTLDGDAPVATKARAIPADPAVTWSVNAGPNITVKCIAATAAQVTGAATIFTEVK
jgi:hypothetical protein